MLAVPGPRGATLKRLQAATFAGRQPTCDKTWKHCRLYCLSGLRWQECMKFGRTFLKSVETGFKRGRWGGCGKMRIDEGCTRLHRLTTAVCLGLVLKGPRSRS